ncbi:hypothetical protein DFJ58DRAFT_803624, partial [Suillus subalutaceus]|uniref:uncharacterized protein n=1 Tax=Suillus subalutaceus TaxID=48586 RepID=UPI001B870C92
MYHEQIGQPLEHTTLVSCVAISLSGELLHSGWIPHTISTLPAAVGLKLGQMLYTEALSDAEKVIELNPSSYLGYEL